MGRGKTTSRRVASLASRLLRNSRVSQRVKSVAASALAQRQRGRRSRGK